LCAEASPRRNGVAKKNPAYVISRDITNFRRWYRAFEWDPDERIGVSANVANACRTKDLILRLRGNI